MPMSFYGQDNDAKKENKSSSFSRHLFIQGQIGASWFHGDLAKYGVAPDLANTQLSGGLGIGYQLLPWLDLRGNLNRGFVKGEKEM